MESVKFTAVRRGIRLSVVALDGRTILRLVMESTGRLLADLPIADVSEADQTLAKALGIIEEVMGAESPPERESEPMNTTPLSKSAISLLTKMTKGTKGSLLLATLSEVAPSLGFTITREVYPRPGLSLFGQRLLREIIRNDGDLYSAADKDAWDSRSVTVYIRGLNYSAGETWQKSMIAKLSAAGEVRMLAKKQEPTQDHGGLWLRGMKADQLSSDWASVDGAVWSPCDAALVKAPGVDPLPLWMSKDRKGVEYQQPDNEAGFWTWFYKSADGVKRAEKALAAIGGPPRRAEHVSGDDSNTGLCQICMRRQKMKASGTGKFSMVDHGYTHELSGHLLGYLGQRHGSCYGVGAEPWERSRDHLGLYIESSLRPSVKRLAENLAKFNEGKVNALEREVDKPREPGESRWEGQKRIRVTFTPENFKEMKGKYHVFQFDWEDMLRAAHHEAESNYNQTNDYLQREEGRYNNWKPRKLFDEEVGERS